MPPRSPSLPEAPPTSALHAVGQWLYRERWLLLLFLAALAVRLHWNLVVHPPGDYVYSDMNGYVSRADRVLRAPFEPHEYQAFFPFGTHWLIAGIKKVFGPDNMRAIGIVYAVLGSMGVAMAYSIARRASNFAWVPPLTGLIAVFYYPHISVGGYVLSELPFSVFLLAAVLFSLRLADRGRISDAWGMGLCCGLGAFFRPQILLSAGAVGLYWLARRKALPNIRFAHLLHAAIPLALCLGVSSWHLHHHTGRRGLVSENGSFNLVFGRCHNSKIESLPDGQGHGKVHFRPPEFLQMNAAQERHEKEGTDPGRVLDPALTDVLSYRGYIGDKEVHMGFVRECMQKTGWLKQLDYSVTNALFLWSYNIPWPDSGKSIWRHPARWWTQNTRLLFAIPSLLALAFIFVPRRETAKLGLVAVNYLGLILLAAAVFGGIRHRTPYDFLIVALALEIYAVVGVYLVNKIRARRLNRATSVSTPR